MSLTIGSLFSGIGGLELGLERAGLGEVIWQVEIDPFCQSVLAKHWPRTQRFHDVTQVGAHCLRYADVLCGGFPCQDVSGAGLQKGMGPGTRSGLWFEYLRIVQEVRPRIVIVENVASGKKLWLPVVKRGLRGLGYGVRAFSLSAQDVGAPHLRRRIFVIAYPHGHSLPLEHGWGTRESRESSLFSGLLSQAGATGNSHGYGESASPVHGQASGVCGVASEPPLWASPPIFRGMDDGVSRRVDEAIRRARNKALGNAVVPQCAEVIGRIALDLLLSHHGP